MAKKSDCVVEAEQKIKIIKEMAKQQLARHKLKMIELQTARENEDIAHKHAMERQRIKSAEIRKMQERKDFYKNSKGWN